MAVKFKTLEEFFGACEWSFHFDLVEDKLHGLFNLSYQREHVGSFNTEYGLLYLCSTVIDHYVYYDRGIVHAITTAAYSIFEIPINEIVVYILPRGYKKVLE